MNRGFIVDSVARLAGYCFWLIHLSFWQRPNRMPSMNARHLYKFVRGFSFCRSALGVVSLRYRFDPFSSGCQAELSPDSAARHVDN